MNVSKLLFFSVMILGTLLTLSSATWLGMWMGLEMNLISFIPILFKSKNMKTSESCMIYFLIQSLGSILMLISVLSNSLITMSPYVISELLNMILAFSMMIKLGIPPFHFWFPEILEKMNWVNCSILMTWQKIAPLSILSLTISQLWLLPLIVMMTTIVGAIGGLNQTSIRKIMGYSSINHMGWMMACMMMNNEMWMKYLLIYSLIILTTTFTFNLYNSFYINQFTLNVPFMMDKVVITSLFLSLGGLPPFLGFLPKWLVIQSMIGTHLYFMLTVMIMSVLFTLYYYLRIVNSTLMMYSTIIKWSTPQSIKYGSTSIFIMNLSLPLFATLGL